MSDPTPNPSPESSKSPRGLLYGIGALVLVGLGTSAFLMSKQSNTPPETAVDTPAEVVASATPSPSDAPAAETNAGEVDLSVDENGLSKAVVTIETAKGNISFRFYAKDAPATVARIAELVKSGFYNGLTFHRVVPDFVIQGGDPLGNGTGGSGQKLKAEFNARKHVLGTVAMARSQDPDSADSQFYIALGPIPHLDGSYTVFGQVSEGLENVKKIEMGDTMTKVSIK